MAISFHLKVVLEVRVSVVEDKGFSEETIKFVQ